MELILKLWFKAYVCFGTACQTTTSAKKYKFFANFELMHIPEYWELEGVPPISLKVCVCKEQACVIAFIPTCVVEVIVLFM